MSPGRRPFRRTIPPSSSRPLRWPGLGTRAIGGAAGVSPPWSEGFVPLGLPRPEDDVHPRDVRVFVVPELEDVQGGADLDVAEAQAVVPVVAAPVDLELAAGPLARAPGGE